MWEALQTLWEDLPAIEARLRALMLFSFGDSGAGLWIAAALHGIAIGAVISVIQDAWERRQKNKRRY